MPLEEKQSYKPWGTILFAVINILVFFIAEWMGETLDPDFIIKMGGLYKDNIVNGEYYRFFTACFLHFGFEHLLNNMVMLLAIGHVLEKAIGHIHFVILYLMSGVGGMIGSYCIRDWQGALDHTVIAGASGAIFGLFGALTMVALLSKGRVGDLQGKKLAVVIVIILVYGYAQGGTDVWGHAFGLITGIILSFLGLNLRRITNILMNR